MSWTCPECGLPDLHNGYGDGIGSCGCPRCPLCGEPDPAGMHPAMHDEDDRATAGQDWPGDETVEVGDAP